MRVLSSNSRNVYGTYLVALELAVLAVASVRTEQSFNFSNNDLDSYTSTVMSKIADMRVTQYVNAMINITYVDKIKRNIFTSTRPYGRFSNGGVKSFFGLAALLYSQTNYQCLNFTPITTEESDNETVAESGCTLPLNITKPTVPTIAIIKRGVCRFDKKVENAESMGAIGVIIYDDEIDDNLKTIQVEKDRIPTIFTYRTTGEEIVSRIQEGHKVYISVWEHQACLVMESAKELRCKNYYDAINGETIDRGIPRNAVPSSPENISGYVAIVALCIAVLMAILITLFLQYYYHRHSSMQNKEMLERKLGKKTKKALTQVTLFLATGNEGDCTVCIELMKSGDEARQLPCGHTFHRACVDDWLLKRRKCPLCNLNIVEHFGLLDANNEQSEDEYETSGITAL